MRDTMCGYEGAVFLGLGPSVGLQAIASCGLFVLPGCWPDLCACRRVPRVHVGGRACARVRVCRQVVSLFVQSK